MTPNRNEAMRRRLSFTLHALFLGGCVLVLGLEGSRAAMSLECLLRGPYPSAEGALQDIAGAGSGTVPDAIAVEVEGPVVQLASAAER